MIAASLDSPDSFPAKSPKTRPKRSGVYFQAQELQGLLLQSARDTETTPSALAQVARAFADLEELKLRLRMKPAPKPIDVSVKPKRNVARSGFADLPAEQQKPVAPEKPTDAV